MMDNRTRVVSNFLWRFFERIGAQMITVIVNIILARKLGWSLDKTQSVLDEMVKVGIVEYNWHNSDHHKQYVLPVFVVGSAENFMLNAKLMEEFPETAERMKEAGMKISQLFQTGDCCECCFDTQDAFSVVIGLANA